MTNVTKRSVSTDALETLGTIIDETQKRDAIHLAVMPVVAGKRLKPGQTIALENGVAVPNKDGLGIVDPFLQSPALPGDRFWMVLKPRLVTSLRHVWTHPSFVDDDAMSVVNDLEQAKARAEIERIAEEVDCEFHKLINGANDYLDSGDYLNEGGRWEGTYLPDEFWPAFETYAGRKVPDDERGSFFSCSC